MSTKRRITDLLGIGLPILQAPMAGASGAELAIAVSEAGGLGSLPCAMLRPDEVRDSFAAIRQRTSRPINLNFFCHVPPAPNVERETRWKARLANYYRELGVEMAVPVSAPSRAPFDEAMCEVVMEMRPEVVSFHFGLPRQPLLERVTASGAKILSSATTVAEAVWLERAGCDAVIAQGFEAGGHRGMFLTSDAATQVGTMALVPQIVDAVRIPVIAAGGIGDARGIVAAFALGASGVQLGTAYLRCRESVATALHRRALETVHDDQMVLTNVFTGRPARGIMNRFAREVGPISDLAPEFPLASGAVAPLRAEAESRDSWDFSALWAGQAARLSRDMDAAALTKMLARESARLLATLRLD